MMAEYQTALELEMWKQQQEELFIAQVSQFCLNVNI
jgi:hypothetical protein